MNNFNCDIKITNIIISKLEKEEAKRLHKQEIINNISDIVNFLLDNKNITQKKAQKIIDRANTYKKYETLVKFYDKFLTKHKDEQKKCSNYVNFFNKYFKNIEPEVIIQETIQEITPEFINNNDDVCTIEIKPQYAKEVLIENIIEEIKQPIKINRNYCKVITKYIF